jgi:class 3 adenylate cyclase
MDIVIWLQSLGLGKYEAAFRENEIDETVLPSLTHETLKELGVTAVGHRLKLLDAIGALRADTSIKPPIVATEAAPPPAATPTRPPVAEAVGERRHVTVMFCDLVGSTGISAALDAEDWRDLVGAYLEAASAAVTELGGHVAKKLGDGLMALFGYPVAQENDAERAARAGLSIQRALAEVNHKNAGLGKPALKARIGIETGPVVVDAAGEIYGDAPNTAAKFMFFDGDAACGLARQFLDLAEQQKATAPIMIGHRLLGTTLLCLGESAEGLKHLEQAFALYEPAAHRSLTTHFGHDVGVATLSLRSLALWLLGYPETALVEIDHAINAARETAHAPTLMFALAMTSFTQICCRNHARANSQIDECALLADEKSAPFWKAAAMAHRGWVMALTSNSAEAIQTISAGLTEYRSLGAKIWTISWLSQLALSHASLGKFDDAWRCTSEAISAVETTKERWWEPEVHRTAGEIALLSRGQDAAKAEAYFSRALVVASQQQAKSLELRAAMSLARLWRDQGKVQRARELLAPVYDWFNEGFDTRDLREAKALLHELAA